MEDRIRQILNEQSMMRGQGYETHMGALKGVATRRRRVMRELGGDAANKKAARRSPWINFLKHVTKEYGIPYNEAMVDPKIREMYHSQGGALVGGSPIGGATNCWSKFRHDAKPLPKKKRSVKKEYEKYLESGVCVPKKSTYMKYVKKRR